MNNVKSILIIFGLCLTGVHGCVLEEPCEDVEGMVDGVCRNGEWTVFRCMEHYELIENKCVLPQIYHCGSDDEQSEGTQNYGINCYDWLRESIYSSNTEDDLYNHFNLDCISSDQKDGKQCAITSCKDGYVYVSCHEFMQKYRDYYPDLNVPLCHQDDADSTYICIKDICSENAEKVVPEQCGCDKHEDAGDDDHDGVINCKDACPKNPTKSKMSYNDGVGKENDTIWWSDAVDGDVLVSAGIRCDVWDSDRDGVDDSEDVCPWNPNIKDGESENGVDCGNEVSGEDGIPEFHIWNANDLIDLQNKLVAVYDSKYCTEDEEGETKCETYKRMKQCVHGQWHYYQCGYCNSYTSDGKIECGNQTEIIDNSEIHLRVIFETDINLDDIQELSIVLNDAESSVCYGVWQPIKYMKNIVIKGNNHTISYSRKNIIDNESNIRCSLFNALFDQLENCQVHDLNIDFDMSGYGRGVFSNDIISGAFTRVNVIKSVMNSNEKSNDGIGAIAGRIVSDSSHGVLFSDCSFSHIEVNGSNAGIVGSFTGILGDEKEDAQEIVIKNCTWKDSRVQVESGKNYVGGIAGIVQGKPENVRIEDCSTEHLTVLASDSENVGGVAGLLGAVTIKSFDHNVDSVTGKNSVGGFAGKAVETKFERIVSMVDSVMGLNDVGGFIGYGELSELSGYRDLGCFVNSTMRELDVVNDCWYEYGMNIWIYNAVNYIMGNQNIGGLFGTLLINKYSIEKYYEVILGNIYNNILNIYGNSYVGGLIGKFTSYYFMRQGIIRNRIDFIDAKSEDNSVSLSYIGGMIGWSVSGNMDSFDVYNHVRVINASHGNFVGGLIGITMPALTKKITKLYNKIDVMYGGSYVAGLVSGFNPDGPEESFYAQQFYSRVNIYGEHYVSAFLNGVRDEVTDAHSGTKKVFYTNIELPNLKEGTVIANIHGTDCSLEDPENACYLSGLATNVNHTAMDIQKVFLGLDIEHEGTKVCRGLFSTCLRPGSDYYSCDHQLVFNDDPTHSVYLFNQCQEDSSLAASIDENGSMSYSQGPYPARHTQEELDRILTGWKREEWTVGCDEEQDSDCSGSTFEVPVVMTDKNFNIGDSAILNRIEEWRLSLVNENRSSL